LRGALPIPTFHQSARFGALFTLPASLRVHVEVRKSEPREKYVMKRVWLLTATAAVASFGVATMAAAQPARPQQPTNQVERTPFNYDVVDGKRVPKANRVVNADGSWREEVRQGKCLTVKEKSAAGEYKETRSCG
jgi:hypothetical protein